jgi:hypothetical protein
MFKNYFVLTIQIQMTETSENSKISEKFVNQVTLDCLMNKGKFSNKSYNCVNKKDKKFYRKRVYNLTKELLLSKEEPSDLFPDVKYAFDNFVNTCINYFKVIDNNDIIQSDYQNINDSLNIGSTIKELNVDDIHSQEQADKLLMKSIKISNSLDGFIKRKKIGKQNEIILPKQKDINLKDPSLKIKGISNSFKKKNITNKYEENDTKKESNQDKKNDA